MSEFWQGLSRTVFAGRGHLTCKHATEWLCDFWLAQLFNGRIVVRVSNVDRKPRNVDRWFERCEPFDLFGVLDDGRSLMAKGIHWTWALDSCSAGTFEGVVHHPNCVEITDPDNTGLPVKQVICEVTNLLPSRRIEPIELDDGVQIELGPSSDHNDNRRRVECLKTAGILVVGIQSSKQLTEAQANDLSDALCGVLTFAQRSPVHCVAQHWKCAEAKGKVIRSKYQEPVFYYPPLLRPLIPAESLADFIRATLATYQDQWKAWDLGHAIDHYVQAMSLCSVWSQAIGFFTSLETLKNAFLRQPGRARLEYHVPKGQFKGKRIASQVMELLSTNFDAFRELSHDERTSLHGKMGELNRRAYKLVLKELFEALRLLVEDDELNHLVKFRNQIIHRGSPDYTKSPWKDPVEAGMEVARFAGLVERVILAVLGYHGSFERYDEILVAPDE